jgi:steroid 5-alpha reductase family enzyme
MTSLTPGAMLAAAFAAMLAIALATWVLSVVKRDASVVDGVWSLLFLAAAFVYALAGDTDASRATWLLALVLVWSVRLSAHIIRRGWGEPEDHRYQAIRARNEPGFAWKSAYLVFGLQAVLAWIVSLSLFAGFTGNAPAGWLDVAGFALAAAGILIETVADSQLARFKSDPASAGQVMDRGLWRYSRHPNYFGEFCVWWGFFLVGLSAGGWAAAWTLVSPLLMSVLLLKVSGVALLESDIGSRRPAYRDYVARTNAFFPGRPKARGAEARP